MAEFDLTATISIDETDRIQGLSDVNLSVTLKAFEAPAIIAEPLLRRYWFRAQLMAFGRAGNPSRNNAVLRTRFGTRVTTHEPRFNFRTGRFEWVPVERILQAHPFRLAEVPRDSTAVLKGRSNLTVEIGLLDIARAPRLVVGEREVNVDPDAAADAIFARVEMLDNENDNAVVLSADSNVISDFFGADERGHSGGDDREFPRFPRMFIPFEFS